MHAQTATQLVTPVADQQAGWMDGTSHAQHLVKLSHNEPLFYDGDEADFIYEVVEGLIVSYNILPDGRRQILGFSYPGDIVGLSHDGIHHYCCSASGATQVRSMPRRMLMRIARERPEIAAKLLVCATSQLNRVQDHFVLLGCKCAQEKVASFLLELAKRYAAKGARSVTFELPVKRSDIADYLGTTIETVSRQLTKLKTAGVIDLPQTSVVHVRDMIALGQLAEADDDTF